MIACTENENVCCSQTDDNYLRPEEYIPIGKSQEIKLKSGMTVYMDIDSTYYLEDQIFSKEQIKAMNISTTRSAAIKDYVKYWTNRTIPYAIESGNLGYGSFSTYYKNMIRQALDSISNACYLRFVETTNLGNHYIYFIPSNQNSSSIGMQNGGNIVRLSATGFLVGNAIHEVMHALGFFHEHTRDDRDNYINLLDELNL